MNYARELLAKAANEGVYINIKSEDGARLYRGTSDHKAWQAVQASREPVEAVFHPKGYGEQWILIMPSMDGQDAVENYSGAWVGRKFIEIEAEEQYRKEMGHE